MIMKTSLEWLDVGDERLAVEIYSPTAGYSPIAGIIVLHGSGLSDKSRGQAVCSTLATLGCQCVAFDFSGAGQSTRHSPLTLAKRTTEAQAVLQRYLSNFDYKGVVAFSMSGHSAIDLAVNCHLRINGMILCSPAIYAEKANEIHFGPEFTRCLREPDSWRTSAAPRKLARFTGKTCFIVPGYDEVIPSEVLTLLEGALPSANCRKIVMYGAPHTLGSWFNNHPDEAESAIGQAWEFIFAGSATQIDRAQF